MRFRLFLCYDKLEAEDCVLSDYFLNLHKEESINYLGTENVYIKGDNLHALQILQKTHKNKIGVIYIDPPYNTGKTFIYNDNHKKWSEMMKPRLELSRNLLNDDGVIFISIDENEIHNLKTLCNEIYGADNFITTFIWEKTQHFGRQKLNAYSNAEYILCYAKQLRNEKLKELLVERIHNNLLDAPLYNASNNITTISFPPETVKFNIKNGTYNKTSSDMYKLITPVEVSDGYNKNEFSLRFRSRWSNSKVAEEIKKGTTFWVKTEAFAIRAIYGTDKFTKIAPKQIIFTNSKNEYRTCSRFGEKVTTTESATKELGKIIESDSFDYPKPISLISYLLSLLFDSKRGVFINDFTVLDFFSGSGTTAHACMHLNSIDGGKRKFILVQKPDLIKNKKLNIKYKNLCDIGLERIRRAGMYINKKCPSVDTGCKVYEIESK